MILTLFLALMALAVVIIILGYFTGDEPYLTVGLFFFFLLSIIILSGNLEYKTGELHTPCGFYETYIYGDNYTDYHFDYDYSAPPGLADINLFHRNRTYSGCVETTTDVYTAWSDTTSHWIGWGLGIISGFGIALSLYNSRKRRMNSDE